MKKSILLFSSLLLFVSCNTGKDKEKVKPKEVTKLIISGVIINPKDSVVKIINSNYEQVASMLLDKTNHFRDTLDLETAYYTIKHGPETTAAYFKKGSKIQVSIDTKQFDETVSFKGEGANESNFLAQKYLVEEKSFKIKEIALLEEKDFLKRLDSVYSKIGKNLELKGLSEDFKALQLKVIDIEKLSKLTTYPRYRKYLGKKDYKISSTYPDPYTDENMKAYLSNENLLEAPNYLKFISGYLNMKAQEEYKAKNLKTSYVLAIMNSYDSLVLNKKIKEELMYSSVRFLSKSGKDLDSTYLIIKKNLTGKKLEKVTLLYNRIKKLEKGQVSPKFSFIDINNKEVTLDSLKGSLVYIDIWATWCGPCQAEMPALKIIQEEFKDKNIKFVSICKSDTKANWEAFLKDDTVKGIQLFAKDSKAAFFKDYIVDGIPRFILIDKEGKIIDANAARPSNPKIKEILNENLK